MKKTVLQCFATKKPQKRINTGKPRTGESASPTGATTGTAATERRPFQLGVSRAKRRRKLQTWSEDRWMERGVRGDATVLQVRLGFWTKFDLSCIQLDINKGQQGHEA